MLSKLFTNTFSILPLVTSKLYGICNPLTASGIVKSVVGFRSSEINAPLTDVSVTKG